MIGYLRVSTESQATADRTSLADQEAAVVALAGRLGGTVALWFKDAGASGATVEGRPEFQRLLFHCQSHPRPADSPGYVLVLNDSRFGRFPDPEESAYWRHHLRRHGWIVQYAEGDVPGDASTIVRAVTSVEASTYRKNLIKNTRRGMRGAGEQGYWTRREPFGFRRQTTTGRVLNPRERKSEDERVKLTPYEPEAEVVRWMFRTYAGGASAAELARQLETRVPHRQWSPHTTLQVLRNRAYVGDVVGGRRKSKTNGVPRVPYECLDAHPAIVSRELFQACQDRMAQNQKLGPAVRGTYLLSGVMMCPFCGLHYTGGGGGKSREPKPVREHRRFYRDSGGINGTCPGRIGTVMRHLIDDRVVAEVADVLRAPKTQQVISACYEEMLKSRQGEDQSKPLRAKLRSLKQRKERVVASIAEGILTPDEARAQMDAARAEIEAAEARLALAKTAQEHADELLSERDAIVTLTQHLGKFAANLQGSKRRELILPWIKSATFDKRSRELKLEVWPLPGPGPGAGPPLPPDLLEAMGGPLARTLRPTYSRAPG